MKVRYFENMDKLLIEFRDALVAQNRDLDENMAPDVDAKGKHCLMTIQHASVRAGAPQNSVEKVAASNRWRGQEGA